MIIYLLCILGIRVVVELIRQFRLLAALIILINSRKHTSRCGEPGVVRIARSIRCVWCCGVWSGSGLCFLDLTFKKRFLLSWLCVSEQDNATSWLTNGQLWNQYCREVILPS